MLKKICKLFLGLVVCAGSACVTPTHASSAPSVFMTHIQAGGVSGAKEEAIGLYNTTALEVDVTGWCLVNKSDTSFACFTKENEAGNSFVYTLPAFGYASVVSTEYVTKSQMPESAFSLIYTPGALSSGSITGSADTITLLDADNEVRDVKSWVTALAAGKSLTRLRLMTNPDTYATTGAVSDWLVETIPGVPQSTVTTTEVIRNDAEPPLRPEEGEGPNPPLSTPPVPIITEVYANPPGADAGGEYIELMNPHTTEPLHLQGFRLRVGFDSPKWYTFPEDILQPGEYKVYSNLLMGFTLVNTTGRVQLFQGTTAIGEPIEYSAPKEGQAWSLIGDTWQYTLPTPGAFNASEVPAPSTATQENESTAVQKPCAANQYRNPETGRCKLVAAAAAAPAPCKPGQERNPETGRCRTLASAVKGAAACKEGQERNPETNRCRNIVKMTKAGHGLEVKAGADNQPSWYYWLALGSLVAAILGYAIWEWREELSGMWGRARSLLTR